MYAIIAFIFVWYLASKVLDVHDLHRKLMANTVEAINRAVLTFWL